MSKTSQDLSFQPVSSYLSVASLDDVDRDDWRPVISCDQQRVLDVAILQLLVELLTAQDVSLRNLVRSVFLTGPTSIYVFQY